MTENKENDMHRYFYAYVKRNYLEEFEEGKIIQVMHWCIFFKEQTLKSEYKAFSKKRSILFEPLKGKQKGMLVKFGVPKDGFNSYVIRRDEEEYFIIPPFTVLMINNVVNSSMKITIGKDNKAYLDYNFGRRDLKELFIYPSSSESSSSE